MKNFVFFVKTILSKLIKLPSLENRTLRNEGSRMLMPSLNLSNEIDFLIYRLMMSSLKITFLILSFMWFDACLGMSIIVDSDKFLHDRIEVSVAFGNVIIIPMILLYFAYYLRIRLFVDISNEDIPIPSHTAYLSDLNRKNWLKRSAFAIACMVLLLFLSATGAAGIATYFRIHDDILAVFVLSIAMGFAVSGIPPIIIMQALIFEKAYFHFNSFSSQFTKLSKHRKSQYK